MHVFSACFGKFLTNFLKCTCAACQSCSGVSQEPSMPLECSVPVQGNTKLTGWLIFILKNRNFLLVI